MTTPLIETDCTVTHDGQQYAAGGAVLAPCKDGRWRGAVYAHPPGHDRQAAGSVTTWHGQRIAAAWFGRTYRGNFCRMRSVRFQWHGMTFAGRYCPDWAQVVRVRTTTTIERPVS